MDAKPNSREPDNRSQTDAQGKNGPCRKERTGSGRMEKTDYPTGKMEPGLRQQKEKKRVEGEANEGRGPNSMIGGNIICLGKVTKK